jgi:spermidine/putrescine-binding protein
MQFLEFFQTPEIAALNAEDVWFATPNQKAIPFTSEEYQLDEELYPKQEIIDKSPVYQAISSEALTLRTRMLNALGRL